MALLRNRSANFRFATPWCALTAGSSLSFRRAFWRSSAGNRISDESFGCSLEMRHPDVVESQFQMVFLLFNQLTDIMIETSTFAASSGGKCREQLRSGQSSSKRTLLLRLVFSCTWSRSGLLGSWIHRLVCDHPDQLQRFLACILALLQRNNFVYTFRMYPFNLFT